MSDQILDQHEAWLARQEVRQTKSEERLADHVAQPWHTGFAPLNAEMLRRIDRMESTLLGVAKWMIGVLFAILAALAAILGVAVRILDKPPGQ